MSNKKFNEFKSLFIPSDIMPISMILIGIIISLFISEIAIKLIGVSISILGVVVLLMKLTTRMSSAVETKFKSNPPPNFKITIKKSPEAVRQVIENYSGDIEDKEIKSDSEITETPIIINKPVKNTMGDEEGFRIVRKEIESENENESIIQPESDTTISDNSIEEIQEEVIKIEKNEVEQNIHQESNFKSPNR
jgi:hypothetical protein